MKAPVSWIREHVDLPDDVTTELLAARLTALGLKLEAIDRPADQITGPLVVGRVLTRDPEPQKNGKTINWCTVDVGDANGTGEPQGIVCGAHNFEPGDLVVVVLPGGVLPGGFEISARKTYGHLSAGMICSARELGLGEDHDGIIVLPTDAGAPGDDAFGVLGLDDDVIEFEINPDRAYALSIRGVAREAALAYGAPFHDPAERHVPPADDDGWPVVVDDPRGCPVFVARLVEDFDPSAPTPDWMAKRLTQAGMRPISLAVDVTNYVMLEIGRPIHGYDADKLQGTVGVRRAVEGETLTTLDGTRRTLSPEDLVVTDDSGIIGLGGVMGGQDTEISATTTRVLVEAAHWDATSMFRTGKRHRISSEAGKRNERGVDPTVTAAAADRVVELLTTHGGATASPGSPWWARRPTCPSSRSPPTCPSASAAWASPAPPRSSTCGRWAAPSTTASCSSTWCRRPGAPTSPTPSTSSRRWRGSSGTTRCRRCSPRRPPAAGSRARSGCDAGSAGSWPVPAASRSSASRSWARRPLTSSGCPRTTSGATRSRSPTRCPRRSRATPPRSCPGCSRLRRATSAAAPPASPSSRPGPSPSPQTVARPPSTGSTGDPTTPSSRSCSRRSLPSRCTSAWSSPGSANAPAGGAAAARAAGPTPSSWCVV